MASHRSRHQRSGNMLVGAALLLPLLFLVTFGLLEFGWIFVKVQQVNNAARHGARVGARIDATTADVQSAVDTLMAEAEITGYTTSIVPALEDLDTGQILTVTISLPYAGNADLEFMAAPSFLPVPDTLEAKVSMAREFN